MVLRLAENTSSKSRRRFGGRGSVLDLDASQAFLDGAGRATSSVHASVRIDQFFVTRKAWRVLRQWTAADRRSCTAYAC